MKINVFKCLNLIALLSMPLQKNQISKLNIIFYPIFKRFYLISIYTYLK
ncbi:hypothetical protein ACINWC323_3191 [Acinetobacter sp. WC-323]|nr:hypothetical protein ACINWC323_3191 [Acinetobacter sp. WC-323]